MHRKLKIFWDRYEGWAAPLAMVFFLLTGLQVGARIGSSETQLLSAQTIKDMQVQLESKDSIIADKDSRLRAMQDLQLNQKDTSDATAAKSADAATEAAIAAREAAEAAKRSAEAANKVSP
ncbi:hypothetical protein GOD54_23590 [Sinorhizobium medicae]|nr:hypothetical protein [Sinorhizobium medicae]